MFRSRLIPIILIENRGLYKSIKFKNHRYIGDPLNTIRLFNDKEVDELIILDIGARKSTKGIDFEYLEKLSAECFMP
jgi:cyclase